jgi:hypothetical protein
MLRVWLLLITATASIASSPKIKINPVELDANYSPHFADAASAKGVNDENFPEFRTNNSISRFLWHLGGVAKLSNCHQRINGNTIPLVHK